VTCEPLLRVEAAVVLTNTAIVASDLFPIQLIDDGQEKSGCRRMTAAKTTRVGEGT
jgi:hypothetical protein